MAVFAKPLLRAVTVIHKGFGQASKPLGHLGTFVLKKAETVFDLDVDNNTKEVTFLALIQEAIHLSLLNSILTKILCLTLLSD